MGRPRKQTADFFPHYVGGSRKTIFVLENRWGNDGYAFWFKLLELLCQCDGHYYDCTKQADMDYLTALTRVPQETALNIIGTLTDRDNIDKDLWEQRRIIWCQALVNNLAAMYSKRTVSAPAKPFSADFPHRKLSDNEIPDDGKPQSRVEERRVEESRVDESRVDESRVDESIPEDAPEETPTKKGRAKKTKPDKIRYAEFVTLTENEHAKLAAEHGEEATARMIEILNNYKGSRKKQYASDYFAILNWVVDRYEDEKARKGGPNHGHTQHPGEFIPSDGFRRADNS